MNRSYSKIRHIKQANILLEQRLVNENTLGLSDDMLIQLRKSNGIPELMLDKQSWESLYNKYGNELLKGDPRTVSYEDFDQEIKNTGERMIEKHRSMYEKMKSVSHKSRNIKSRDFQTTFNRYKDMFDK